jgi:hypothetical protein
MAKKEFDSWTVAIRGGGGCMGICGLKDRHMPAQAEDAEGLGKWLSHYEPPARLAMHAERENDE